MNNNGYIPRRAMSIQAHPDDQDFTIAGTLAKWARAGTEVISVIITREQATHRTRSWQRAVIRSATAVHV
ncbi:MAG TPA: PIG-L family deacetylase [Anaerolineales bacterium]|nr:PIG-L family deacetylase [Anaerolineales bacterium]